jgi:hypothetical protein
MTLFTISLIAAGCGGDSESKSDEPAALVLKAGSPPSERDCGFDTADAIEPAPPGSDRIAAPDPGIYLYATTGTQTTPGESGREQLPHQTESLVTPARKTKDLVCFGSERSLSARTKIPEVYVLRGEDVYITALGFDTPNLVESFNPRPAVLALGSTTSSWTGSFKGSTSGTYRVEIVGRRSFKVGGETVKAVGLQSDATYTGEASGSRRTMTWLAIDRSLVIQESGQSRIKVGGGDERLDYETELLSLTPGKP